MTRQRPPLGFRRSRPIRDRTLGPLASWMHAPLVSLSSCARCGILASSIAEVFLLFSHWLIVGRVTPRIRAAQAPEPQDCLKMLRMASRPVLFSDRGNLLATRLAYAQWRIVSSTFL